MGSWLHRETYPGLADLYFFNLWQSLALEGCLECLLLSALRVCEADSQMFVNFVFLSVINYSITCYAEKKAVICMKHSL